ncbi:MAG TPA: hypothetical protein VE913_18290 [Longimicrobium sp.]|nr:hypothetical protein [Longimicrobium sp.]
MKIHSLRRLTVLAAAAGGFGATALPAQAQEAETKTFCIAGRPLPSCRYFLVATGSHYSRLGGSSYVSEFDVQGRTVRLENPKMQSHYDMEIGVLANRGAEDALGTALSVGLDGDTGFRLALKGRYRRWVGRHAALDASAGVLRAPVESERTVRRIDRPYGYGVTSDLTVGLTDWVSLSGRGDIVWSEGQSTHTLYGGVRLGSLPTLFTGIVAAVVLTAVADAS